MYFVVPGLYVSVNPAPAELVPYLTQVQYVIPFDPAAPAAPEAPAGPSNKVQV